MVYGIFAEAFTYGDWYNSCGRKLFYPFIKVNIYSNFIIHEHDNLNFSRQLGNMLGTTVVHLA
jgi:hypothetical protein